MEIKIYSTNKSTEGIVKATRPNGRPFSKKEASKLSHTGWLWYGSLGLYMAIGFTA